ACFHLPIAFPNPEREGCPPEASLRALASLPRTADPAIEEHISFCSPCTTRYLEILSEQRQATAGRFPVWRPRRWAVSVAITAVFVIGVYIAVRSIFLPKPATQAVYARMVVNL